jgi:aspartate carbamoyltransferase catalytic subunit
LFDSPHVLSIDDLSDLEIDAILARARQFEESRREMRDDFVIGLLFLSSSLRTRVGFSTAALRLGGKPLDVLDVRSGSEMSDAESFEDTLRTVSGMVDVVVTRTPFVLNRTVVEDSCIVPLVNGGDGSEGGEHPTQALIDLLAIEEERGRMHDLTIGVCGDLRSRCARSLLRVLTRRTPRELVLISPAGRDEVGAALDGHLLERTTRRSTGDFSGLDVLYLTGLPQGRGADELNGEARAVFALNGTTVRSLPTDAVVLSPMPVIDEIAAELRADPRVRVFSQSDRGVQVRMAVLERCRSRT